jgi:hypothetical protein
MLKSFLKISFLFVYLPLLGIQCQPGKEIIEQDTFITLYAHLSIISEMQIPLDAKQRLTRQLFTQHNTTEDRFNDTVSHYHQMPEEWIIIIEQVKKKIQELKQLYQPHRGQKKNTATNNRAGTDQPQGFVRPQSQNPGNSQTGPDTTAKRRSR